MPASRPLPLLSLLPAALFPFLFTWENFLDTTGSRCYYFLSDLPEQHFSCFVIMHFVFSVLSAPPSPADYKLYEGKNLVSHNNGFIPDAQHCAWHTEWARLLVGEIKRPEATPFHNDPSKHSLCLSAHFHTIVLKTSENRARNPRYPRS